MSGTGQPTACPVCNENHSLQAQMNNKGMVNIACERCGRFEIDPVLLGREAPWQGVNHLLSAWVRRQNKARVIPNVGADAKIEDLYSEAWWSKHLEQMGFPETTNEKLNALLLAYGESIDGNYGRQFSFGYPHFIADTAARNQQEIDGLNQLLDELDFIDKMTPRIRAKGWLHIDELRRTTIAGDLAFIAMWFDDVTKAYRSAAIAAIEHCGFRAIVIDQQEFNDFIMNQVISSVRQARFLIADLTSRPESESDGKVRNGVRGGVYWEAGFAYGLARPVIQTCEDSTESRARVHFDIGQYKTIYWKQDELSPQIRPLDKTITNPNFAEKLASTILKTIGRGAYTRGE